MKSTLFMCLKWRHMLCCEPCLRWAYLCVSVCMLGESLFSYWSEICSGTTSNRVAKVKRLPFLWQLLSDLWCQHTRHKHPRTSLSLRVWEWRQSCTPACSITSSWCGLCHCKDLFILRTITKWEAELSFAGLNA